MTTRAFVVGSGRTDTIADVVSGSADLENADYYVSFQSPIGTAFQVASGKTLYITKLTWQGGNPNTGFVLGYGSSGIPEQAAPPAGDVVISPFFGGPVTRLQYSQDVFYTVPQNMYPYMQSESVTDIEASFFGLMF